MILFYNFISCKLIIAIDTILYTNVWNEDMLNNLDKILEVVTLVRCPLNDGRHCYKFSDKLMICEVLVFIVKRVATHVHRKNTLKLLNIFK